MLHIRFIFGEKRVQCPWLNGFEGKRRSFSFENNIVSILNFNCWDYSLKAFENKLQYVLDYFASIF